MKLKEFGPQGRRPSRPLRSANALEWKIDGKLMESNPEYVLRGSLQMGVVIR